VSDLSRTGAPVELIGLTKAYADLPVVDDIDLHVEAGEFLTFLGPSGSGKTTTLNMIAGFTSPTAGDVRVDGSSLLGTPTHRRNMGMVFQGYALFPHLTVADNIAFPLRQRKVRRSDRDRLVRSALEKVELAEFGDRRPAQLSGGQQQRVALARAIVYQPPVLLMDEPLGALDKKLRESLQNEIRTIHRDVGTTFVYVTHDQEEALSLSDRIAVYNQGRIEQVGTGPELYERPASLFVAQFLGDSTLLRGSIDPHDSSILRAGGEPIPVHNPARLTGACGLVLRPERIRLRRDGERTTSTGASVTVQVLDAVYLGHTRKITVRLPSGEVGTVSETSENLTDVSPGDHARAWWDHDKAVLLDIGSDTGSDPGSDPGYITPQPASA